MEDQFKHEVAGLLSGLETRQAQQELLWTLREAAIIPRADGVFGGTEAEQQVLESKPEVWQTKAAYEAFQGMLENLKAEQSLARKKSVAILAMALLFLLAFLFIAIWSVDAVLNRGQPVLVLKGILGGVSPLVSGGLFTWYYRLEKLRSKLIRDSRKLFDLVARMESKTAQSRTAEVPGAASPAQPRKAGK
jgi:hypothetical protein